MSGSMAGPTKIKIYNDSVLKLSFIILSHQHGSNKYPTLKAVASGRISKQLLNLFMHPHPLERLQGIWGSRKRKWGSCL